MVFTSLRLLVSLASVVAIGLASPVETRAEFTAANAIHSMSGQIPQTNQTAVVTTEAPIFLKPGAKTPLRVVPVGTRLEVLDQAGTWVQVAFADPQWGRRVGWVQATLIRVSEAVPVDKTKEPEAGFGKPAPGQSLPRAARVQRRKPQLMVQAFGSAGVNWPLAKKSFDAVGLTSKPMEAGGGAQVANFWHNLFAEVAGSRWSDTGERAFVDSTGKSFPLGIPISIRATYIDVTGGWRFETPLSKPLARTTPYLGAGVGVLRYVERSPFAEQGDDVDKRFTSYHVAGGVEVRIFRWLAVGGDLRYRSVRKVLGAGGVSQALKDKDFGGGALAARVLVGY
jgi:hypothetical protein